MDQGKQILAQLYNRNTRMLPRLKQSQKVVVQLDPDKTSGHQLKLSSAQPKRAAHIVSRLYMAESIPGTGASSNWTLLQQKYQSQNQLVSQR